MTASYPVFKRRLYRICRTAMSIGNPAHFGGRLLEARGSCLRHLPIVGRAAGRRASMSFAPVIAAFSALSRFGACSCLSVGGKSYESINPSTAVRSQLVHGQLTCPLFRA